MAVRIRPARPEDGEALGALATELGYPSTDTQANLSHLLSRDDHRLWVAEREGKAVGYVLAHLHLRLGLEGPMVSLDELVVTEGARGEGAGAALLAAVREWATEQGAARLELITARSLESYRSGFYTRHGFREVASAVLRAPTRVEAPPSDAARPSADDDPRVHFEIGRYGFLVRDGKAKARGDSPCQKKLCFTCLTVEPLARLLYELSLRDDCWFVKLDARPGRHGMVRGRCFLTDPEAVASVWLRYKGTDEVLCTIQDDDFTDPYRPRG